MHRTKELIKNQLPQKFDEVVFCEPIFRAVTISLAFILNYMHLFAFQAPSQDFNSRSTKTSSIQKMFSSSLVKTKHAIVFQVRKPGRLGSSAVMRRTPKAIHGFQSCWSIWPSFWKCVRLASLPLHNICLSDILSSASISRSPITWRYYIHARITICFVFLWDAAHPCFRCTSAEGDTVEQKQRNRELLEVAFPDRPEMRRPAAAFL